MLLQALSESPDNIKNGSVAFVQPHSPVMNGEGMYGERGACLCLFCHQTGREKFMLEQQQILVCGLKLKDEATFQLLLANQCMWFLRSWKV